MSRPFKHTAGIASILFLGLSVAGAGQLEQEGYTTAAVTIGAPGAFVGGFDVLPDQDFAVFDGTEVAAIDAATGSKIKTLFTPPAPVFGSFIRVAPDQQHFYFGESSSGVIYEVPVDGGAGRPVTSIAFNFDLEFDPSGRAFVSAASGAFGENYVHLVDIASGQVDEIAHVPSFSGPISFDPQGNLYLGQPDDHFPPRAGFSRVMWFTKAQVDSAIGPGSLGENDAQTWVDQLDAIYDMDFDSDGDLLITDSWNGTLTEVTAVTRDRVPLLSGGGTGVFTFARFARGTKGLFEPFQPDEADHVVAVEAPFSGASLATTVRPLRATIATQPASPIPPGAFTLSVSNGPRNGLGLMLLADQLIVPELPINVDGIPLYIGFDPATFRLLVPFAFDGAGGYSATSTNPGLGGVSIAAQAIVAHDLLHLLATSSALAITFD